MVEQKINENKSMSETAKEIVGKAGEDMLNACKSHGKVCGKVTLTYQIDSEPEKSQ